MGPRRSHQVDERRLALQLQQLSELRLAESQDRFLADNYHRHRLKAPLDKFVERARLMRDIVFGELYVMTRKKLFRLMTSASLIARINYDVHTHLDSSGL